MLGSCKYLCVLTELDENKSCIMIYNQSLHSDLHINFSCIADCYTIPVKATQW